METTLTTVPIFINHRRYEVDRRPMRGREIVGVAGYGEGYDLLLLRGEGDATGGDVVFADQTVDIQSGLHFRVIPGDRTFGGQ